MKKIALFCIFYTFCFCGQISIKSSSPSSSSSYNSKFDEPKYNGAVPPRFDEGSQDYQKGSYEHDKKRAPHDLYSDYPSRAVR